MITNVLSHPGEERAAIERGRETSITLSYFIRIRRRHSPDIFTKTNISCFLLAKKKIKIKPKTEVDERCKVRRQRMPYLNYTLTSTFLNDSLAPREVAENFLFYHIVVLCTYP